MATSLRIFVLSLLVSVAYGGLYASAQLTVGNTLENELQIIDRIVGTPGAEAPDGTNEYFVIGSTGGYFSGNFGVQTRTPTEAMEVDGDVRVRGEFTTQILELLNDLSILGDLGVGGNAFFDGLLTVSNTLDINGVSSFLGRVVIGPGPISPSYVLRIVGVVNFAGTTYVRGDAIFVEGLGVNVGSFNPAYKLDVNGPVNFLQDAIVAGLLATTNMNISNSATVQNLRIDGEFKKSGGSLGQVLMSDPSGEVVRQYYPLDTLFTVPGLQDGMTIYFDGSKWTASDKVQNLGNQVLITTTGKVLGNTVALGGLQVGGQNVACSSLSAGFVKFDAGCFRGCDGSNWSPLGVCANTCGDAIVQQYEACDDGNTNANDGCNATCSSVEQGFTCTSLPNQPSICSADCTLGNTTVKHGETIQAYTQQTVYAPAQCTSVQQTRTCNDGVFDGNAQFDTCTQIQNLTTAYDWRIELERESRTTVDLNLEVVMGGQTVSPSNPSATVGGAQITMPFSYNTHIQDNAREIFPEVITIAGTPSNTCEFTMQVRNINNNGSSISEAVYVKVYRKRGDVDVLVGVYPVAPNQIATTNALYTVGVINVCGCGNGLVESGEMCDDGNTTPSDGCNASCVLETGRICTGQPSVCSRLNSVTGNDNETVYLQNNQLVASPNLLNFGTYVRAGIQLTARNGLQIGHDNQQCTPANQGLMIYRNDCFYGCDGNKRSPTATCVAPGICNNTVAKVYATGTSYGTTSTRDFCSGGLLSGTIPSFPTVGNPRTWTCLGSNGASNATCTASFVQGCSAQTVNGYNVPSLTNGASTTVYKIVSNIRYEQAYTCNNGTLSTQGAQNSYAWDIVVSPTCIGYCGGNAGYKNRTVTCKRNNSTIVSDSMCTVISAKPASTEPCTTSACTGPSACGINDQTYAWYESSWPSTDPAFFCENSILDGSAPSYPGQGQTEYWTCRYGPGPSQYIACDASRDAQVLTPGACSYYANNGGVNAIIPAEATSLRGGGLDDSFCYQSTNISAPTLPGPGGTTSYQCQGTDGSIANCTLKQTTVPNLCTSNPDPWSRSNPGGYNVQNFCTLPGV